MVPGFLVLLLEFAVLLGFSAVPVNAATPMSKKWAYVEGRFIRDGSGKELIFRGVSIPDPEHLNTKPFERPGINTEILINRAVKEFKANVIRLPIHPEHKDKGPDFFHDPENYIKKHLTPAVELCGKLGIYVIVDMHLVADYREKKELAINFWTKIAGLYKDSPHVIYEIYNEPIKPDNWKIWANEVARPLVELIRSKAPNNLLIVGAPYWSAHLKGLLNEPIKGKNIIYSAHIYPNQFNRPDWNVEYEKVLNQYPLFITEWGYSGDSLDPVTRGTTSEFGRTLLNWMTKNRLSWSAFLFDFVWDLPMFDSNWKLLGGENNMGELVKEGLLQNEK